MIDLGFINGELATVTSTETWFASYSLHGNYLLSTAEGPGTYNVIEESTLGQHWTTNVDTSAFQSIYQTGELLVFVPAFNGNNAAATPEASTWIMLAMGFACLAQVARRRKTALARLGG